MRLEGRKLILEEDFENIIEYITIKNADNKYIYEILYNGEKYSTQNIDNTIIFKVPNILTENTISVRVYNLNNQYLYSTNTVSINKNNNKIEEEYYNFQTEILSKYTDLESLFNITTNKLNNKDREILNKMDILSKNLANNEDIENIKNEIKNMDFYDKNEINKICNNIKSSIDKLENVAKNFADNITKLQKDKDNMNQNINNISNDFNEKFSNIEKYDDKYLKQKISDTESFCKELDEGVKKLNKLYNQLNYQEQIDKILKEVSTLDNADKINSMEEHMNSIEGKIENSNIEEKIDVLRNGINENSKEILNLEEFVKNNNHIELKNNIENQEKKITKINQDIAKIEKNIYNKLKLEYDILFEKYNVLLEEHKEFKKDKSIFLPINIDRKIDPYVFINSKDGEIEKYSYSNNRAPIGVSDEYGNVIIRGKAKVKYVNDIFEGDLVYGNRDGIAEHYDKGFIVTKIIDKNYCEIMI